MYLLLRQGSLKTAIVSEADWLVVKIAHVHNFFHSVKCIVWSTTDKCPIGSLGISICLSPDIVLFAVQ